MARFRAGWWWIDRWRRSTAYTDMTLEEQGAYRNLLDELWLRDGTLPKDERILAKISGDALAWSRVRTAVMARFYDDGNGGLRNETHDAIQAESNRRADKQRAYRARQRGNADSNGAGNKPRNVRHSPDQDQDQISGEGSEPPQTPPKRGGRGKRKKEQRIDAAVEDVFRDEG